MLGALFDAADNGGETLVDHHARSAAQLLESDMFKLDAQILRNELPTYKHCHVLQHGFAAVAETGGLDCATLKYAANIVQDQRGKRLALYILCNDQQRQADFATCSNSAIMSRRTLILRSNKRMYGS